MSSVFKYLGFPEYKIMFFMDDINALFQKKMLKKDRHFSEKEMDYEINKDIAYAISQNLHIYEQNPEKKNFIQILEEFDKYSDQFDDNIITKREFRMYIHNLHSEYPHIKFFQEMQKWKLDDFEKFFLLDTIWDAVSRGDNDFNTHVMNTATDHHKDHTSSLYYFNSILDGEFKLTTLKLIELSKENYRNQIRAKLSKNLLKFLRENENIQIEFFEEENQQLIQTKSIQRKELIYNEKEIQSIEILKNAISETKFKQLQKRLKSKPMPLGIAVLLHGEPGTGKTETVYQLAKSAGRNIFKVDISATKSMWFGESQKLVKKIFTDYQEFKETEKKCPILLFNEADAVIGKRKAAGSSNVADTENAIQNILLEELENFDGILFATTNLIGNLDSAFERRFLYKINFEK